ncbi:unnamed protein product [Auanema sp. JU1783]|nr:unnamed protein product [Auanema sp. JU1783]
MPVAGEMRRQLRFGRFHVFKLFVFFLTVFAVITVLRTSVDSSVFKKLSFLKANKQPLIVVITPTYKRATRLADLTRMANTLMLIKDLHWIVIEDSDTKLECIERLLNRTGLPYSYLAAKTISGYPKRGWYQRTVALNYLRKNRKQILDGHKEGVLYFGDDDNSYDIRLYNDYLRNVKKLGLWAVGMVGGTPVESPDVVNGTVVGFRVKWNPSRMFAVDMAGFGINLQMVFNSTAVFGTSCGRGGGAPETCLIEDMGLTRKDIEPFGYEKDFDRDIVVWHTKSNQPSYDMTKADLNGFIYEYKKKENTTEAESPKKAEEKAQVKIEETVTKKQQE